jgi:hypothetical protein
MHSLASRMRSSLAISVVPFAVLEGIFSHLFWAFRSPPAKEWLIFLTSRDILIFMLYIQKQFPKKELDIFIRCLVRISLLDQYGFEWIKRDILINISDIHSDISFAYLIRISLLDIFGFEWIIQIYMGYVWRIFQWDKIGWISLAWKWNIGYVKISWIDK